MAIAFIPTNEDPKGHRTNWLSMSKADEMICKHFNVEPHPKFFYKGWFNSFYLFDWFKCKSLSTDNYSVVFETSEEAKKHFFNKMFKAEILEGGFDIDGISYYQTIILPIIDLIYKKGFRIVSLNIG